MHTSKMNKARVWNGDKNYSDVSGHKSYEFYGDTSMQVVVHDDKTISFFGYTLTYIDETISHLGNVVDVDETNYLTFAQLFSSGSSEVVYLRYYYNIDSIVYFDQSNSPGASIAYRWYTK